MDAFRLDGRVALVTGSTRGIGLAIARTLGQAGAHVVVSSESAVDTATAAALLEAEGLQATGVACDVTDGLAQQALVAAVRERCGRLDVLVCNAGITGAPGPFATLDLANYDRVMHLNRRAMVEMCQL